MTCRQSLRGHLVDIRSASENRDIFNKGNQGRNYWIGLYDVEAGKHGGMSKKALPYGIHLYTNHYRKKREWCWTEG